jgi:hypothetical protein
LALKAIRSGAIWKTLVCAAPEDNEAPGPQEWGGGVGGVGEQSSTSKNRSRSRSRSVAEEEEKEGGRNRTQCSSGATQRVWQQCIGGPAGHTGATGKGTSLRFGLAAMLVLLTSHPLCHPGPGQALLSTSRNPTWGTACHPLACAPGRLTFLPRKMKSER